MNWVLVLGVIFIIKACSTEAKPYDEIVFPSEDSPQIVNVAGGGSSSKSVGNSGSPPTDSSISGTQSPNSSVPNDPNKPTTADSGSMNGTVSPSVAYMKKLDENSTMVPAKDDKISTSGTSKDEKPGKAMAVESMRKPDENSTLVTYEKNSTFAGTARDEKPMKTMALKKATAGQKKKAANMLKNNMLKTINALLANPGDLPPEAIANLKKVKDALKTGKVTPALTEVVEDISDKDAKSASTGNQLLDVLHAVIPLVDGAVLDSVKGLAAFLEGGVDVVDHLLKAVPYPNLDSYVFIT